MAPLMPHLPLKEGETITGYVSRHAALFQTTPRDFCSDLGMRWPFLCSAREDQLEQLAWLTDQPLEVLKARCTRKMLGKRYTIGATVVGADILRRTAIRFCPVCVAEQLRANKPQHVTQMLEWLVLCLQSCPIHHCALVTLPSPPHSHAAYDFIGQIRANKEAVLAAGDASPALPETPFETYIRQRIWDGPHNDWLRDADLSDLHSACATLGASLAGIRVREFGRISAERMSQLVDEGFRNLRAGQHAYLAALQERYAKGAGRPLPESDFGAHFGWLRRNASRSNVSSIVQAARGYVLDAYPIKPKKSFLGEAPPKKRLLTMEGARARTGFGAVFLKKLIGHLQGQTEAEALRRTDVHVDMLAKAERYWATLLNLSDAGRQLAILPAQVRQLQDRGVLTLVRITSTVRYTLRKDVAALLETLQALEAPPLSAPAYSLKAFCKAKGVPLAHAVELWAAGKLAGAVHRGDGDGLHGLAFVPDLLIERPETELRSDLEIQATARYLKINVPAIRQLRDRGYLTEVRHQNPDTKNLKRYISLESIDRFEAAFITLGQLARSRGIAAMHLAQELDRAGLDPVPDLGSGVRIYERHLVV